MKKYCILTLALILFGTALVSAEFLSGEEDDLKHEIKGLYDLAKKSERDTLIGLQGVGVIIDLKHELREYGLTNEAVQIDIELALRRNGIRVLSPKDHNQPNVAVLCVNVNSQVCKELGLAAVNLKVELKQYVLLKRDPKVIRFVDTWRENGVMLIGLDNLKNIRDYIKDMVAIFCNDYLTANPKEKEPVPTR